MCAQTRAAKTSLGFHPTKKEQAFHFVCDGEGKGGAQGAKKNALVQARLLPG